MKIWKLSVLFYLGGMCYSGLELLWRRYTHWSMFLLGGLCFVLVGNLKNRFPRASWPLRLALAAGVITMLELGCGLVVNRSFQVWDYRHLPFNFCGQICLPFTILWIPVSFAGILLYNLAESSIYRLTNTGF